MLRRWNSTSPGNIRTPDATRLHPGIRPSALPRTIPTDTSSKPCCPAQQHPPSQIPSHGTHSMDNSGAKCHPGPGTPCAHWKPPPRRAPAAPNRGHPWPGGPGWGEGGLLGLTWYSLGQKRLTASSAWCHWRPCEPDAFQTALPTRPPVTRT